LNQLTKLKLVECWANPVRKFTNLRLNLLKTIVNPIEQVNLVQILRQGRPKTQRNYQSLSLKKMKWVNKFRLRNQVKHLNMNMNQKNHHSLKSCLIREHRQTFPLA